MSEPLDAVQLFARIARDLASQDDYARTMQRIVELSIQLVGADIAALWEINSGGKVALRATTDSASGQELHSILTRIDEGVATSALRDRRTIVMQDLETEQRWPAYVAAVKQRELPIRSATAYPLSLGGADLGALALYSAKPEYFSPDLIDVGGVLADHAGIALDSARTADKAEHLQTALISNRRIGIAIGILMALHRLTETQAFDLLRTASQNNHVKLHEVAEQVIFSGESPQWPPARRRP
ncbi:GAF and ANTAR domain-containing protein [Jatrophihabitans telluris]|uniref:GAF and ANTAR domain-containing protein n=1 Tax=Jatrophihabitans telluris TaxID=2038343 RepID=A0ABY4QUI2_9ACTN|nr:GAF and ANTAR domain-containing protein [Jatrophihabitans telluris]UQX87115.1 GAF and ANTAR domain-containing protein [Jatrophihabitans telluris]